MKVRTLVIWNGKAGATATAAALYARLSDSTMVELCEPQSRAEAIAMVHDGLDRGLDVVVAAGGDGTVSSVVNALCAQPNDALLGVLPLGTGNDLCRTLGISLDPLEACDLLWPAISRRSRRRGSTKQPKEPVRTIDVIEADSSTGRVFFANAVSGGNAGEVSRHVTAEMKQKWGPWCYVQGAIAVMAGLNGYDTTISFDGGPAEQVRTWAAIIANGRTAGGGVEVAPRAEPEDGLMDVVLVLESNPIEAAILTTNYLLGSFHDSERVCYRQVRQFNIRCEPDAKFVADGEPLSPGPLSFRVRPQALRVVAPAPE